MDRRAFFYLSRRNISLAFNGADDGNFTAWEIGEI